MTKIEQAANRVFGHVERVGQPLPRPAMIFHRAINRKFGRDKGRKHRPLLAMISKRDRPAGLDVSFQRWFITANNYGSR